jgi:hypothetical protein
MLSQIFEVTKTVGLSSADIFNSETETVNCADAVFMGLSIANIGSQLSTISIETKTHPNGDWISRGDFARSASFFFPSSTFYRQVINVGSGSQTGQITANTNAFLFINLKFVYAVRLRARASSLGNMMRVRGNVKIPKNFVYEEKTAQTIITGAVTSATNHSYQDVSGSAFYSLNFSASGTNSASTLAANTLPGLTVSSSGYILAVRFYPGDIPYYIDVINEIDMLSGNRVSLIVETSFILDSVTRQMTYRFYTEAAYEMGFLWNIPSGATITYLVSLNG